jgi:hypothetical protein
MRVMNDEMLIGQFKHRHATAIAKAQADTNTDAATS